MRPSLGEAPGFLLGYPIIPYGGPRVLEICPTHVRSQSDSTGVERMEMSNAESRPSAETKRDQEWLIPRVRDALRHLYDNTYLEHHPLTGSLASPMASGQGFSRSRAIRILLLDAIEALRPPAGTPASDPAWRSHRILTARYIDSSSSAEAMRAVSLGRSQYHKEHSLALAKVAEILALGQTQRQRAASEGRSHWGRHSLLRKEMASLGGRKPAERIDLTKMIGGVLSMFGPMVRQRGLKLAYDPISADKVPVVYSNTVILRQLLVQVVGDVVRKAEWGRLQVTLGPLSESVQLLIRATVASPVKEAVLDPTASELAGALGMTIEERHLRPLASDDVNQVEIALRISTSRRGLVLLIDNDRDLGDLFKRYLVGQRWNLIAVQDADQGTRSVEQLQPDVVILDVIMPDRDGWDVLARLRDEETIRDIPVIVCSVLQQPELALTMGADMFLPKPVDEATLLQALQRFELSIPESSAPREEPG